MFTVWSDDDEARSGSTGCTDKCQHLSTWAAILEISTGCAWSAADGIVDEILMVWSYRWLGLCSHLDRLTGRSEE